MPDVTDAPAGAATSPAYRTITVQVTDRSIFVALRQLSPEERGKLDSIPGGYLCATGSRMYPATVVIARRLVKLFGADGVNFIGGGADRLRDWLYRFDLAHQMRDAETLPDVPGERLPSWHHQKRGFWFGFHMPAVMLSEKVGAGKTKQMLDICGARDKKRVLVLTTASAVDDWPMHVDKHATKPYAVLAMGGAWRAKNATKKAQAVRRHVAENPYCLVALSHDSCWRPPLGAIIKNRAGGKGDIGELARAEFDIIIIDEIHNAADPTGRRSLFIWRLAERIPERIGATGTVIKHKPEDVFSPYRILDAGLFGPAKDYFLERYCVFNRPSDEAIARDRKARAANEPTLPGMENVDAVGDVGPRYVVGYQNTGELARLMSAITYDPGEVDLDLPIPIHSTRRAFLALKGQRAYDDLEREFATTLDDETEIVAPNVLTQMLRLHQCAGGFLGKPVIDTETGEVDFVEIHEVDDAKETLLEDTLRELDPSDPVIIVGRFKHDLEIFRRVCRRVGRQYYEQSGRRKERVKWQEATGGEVLGAQIRSACEAIDLTRSRYTILYSVGYSLYQITQMYGRTDRPGQTRQPHYIHLVSQGTIDEQIYKAIQANKQVAQDVIAQMRAFRFAR